MARRVSPDLLWKINQTVFTNARDTVGGETDEAIILNTHRGMYAGHRVYIIGCIPE